jgi:teichoic acid transport system permease protein
MNFGRQYMKYIKKVISLIKDIYLDKRLLWALSQKDFKRKFAGSYFGMAWAFIQPLLTMLVYWAVFQYGFRSADIGKIPFVLWFICGIIPWLFISESFSIASNSFLEYSYLVKKVAFNINILPLVKILSSFFVHLFFVLLCLLICFILGFSPTVYFLQIFYYMFCMIAFVFAISLIFSSIMVFFRDLNQIIGILLLIGMWGTPIAWNIDMLPSKYHVILKLNPFYYLVLGYRDCFVNHVWFWERYKLMIYFWILTFLLLLIGTILYNRLKPHFADTL